MDKHTAPSFTPLVHLGGMTRNGWSLDVQEHAHPKSTYLKIEIRDINNIYPDVIYLDSDDYVSISDVALQYIENQGYDYRRAMLEAAWDILV